MFFSTNRMKLDSVSSERARDAFTKRVFMRLHEWIICKINTTIGNQHNENNEHFVGILDMPGFEYFEHNSLEQLTINYANECIQQFCLKNLIREGHLSFHHEAVIGRFSKLLTFRIEFIYILLIY